MSIKQTVMRTRLMRTKAALEKRRFAATVVEDAAEARQVIAALIHEGETVSFGGSMTLEETGIQAMICQMPVNIQDRYKEGLSREERNDILRQAFTSDVFITSTNAITMQGELYNIDGTGNRVAAMIFGPKRVIVVAGCNKVVVNEEEAMLRVRNIAAPMNTERLNKDTPCRKLGFCADCTSEQRICDAFTALKRCHEAGRIHVILINEPYGY